MSCPDDGQLGSYQLARWVSTDKRPCGKLDRINPIHNFPVSTSSPNASIAAANLIAERELGLQSERLSVHFRVGINEIVQRIAVLPRVQADVSSQGKLQPVVVVRPEKIILLI